MKVEIVTPGIVALSVTDGGMVQALGNFPVQDSVRATVDQGGAIDIRSMAAANVGCVDRRKAARIFTRRGKAWPAHVAHGGHITYWGSARIRQSVEDGGAVSPRQRRRLQQTAFGLAPRASSIAGYSGIAEYSESALTRPLFRSGRVQLVQRRLRVARSWILGAERRHETLHRFRKRRLSGGLVSQFRLRFAEVIQEMGQVPFAVGESMPAAPHDVGP